MRAFITGISGQDGSFLAELLLKKGYDVYGLLFADRLGTRNIDHILDDITLIDGDLRNFPSLWRAVRKAEPDEVYNLGAVTSIPMSFKDPVNSADVSGMGVLRLLEAVRLGAPNARVFQASTCLMFGNPEVEPQNEATPFLPVLPYAVSKLFAHTMCLAYKREYDMFISTGILYNHESERRGREFVTRKISYGAAKIACGSADKIVLGNLMAKRDWGYAPEYVDMMWRTLQQQNPDDFVAATGQAHSVMDFLEEAFSVIGEDWRPYVDVDAKFLRPMEAKGKIFRGDASKAWTVLGWRPKVNFEQLVKNMVEADIRSLNTRDDM